MNTALLLIDIQNDYFPGGAMELVGAEQAALNAAWLLNTFREGQLPIFHVQHIAAHPGATFFLPNTSGADIHLSVKPADNESLTVKHFPNSFHETTLLESLRSANITTLVIAGMMTHMCIDTTVRAALDDGFTCQLALDACATRDLFFEGERVKAHDVHLAYMAALNGTFASVQSTKTLCETI